MASEQECECPLCMELMEPTDRQCFPCTCIYQVCKYCWYRLLLSSTPVCPGCRAAYNPSAALQQFHATWLARVENIRCDKTHGQLAFKILNILAYCRADSPISTAIFSNHSISEVDCNIALKLLLSESLLTRQNNVFLISKIIQTKVRKFADEVSVLQEAINLFEPLLEIDIKEQFPHAMAVWKNTLAHDRIVKANVLYLTLLCDKLDAAGYYEWYLETSEMTLPKFDILFGPFDVNTLRIKSDIATALWRLNKLDEAQEWFHELLPLTRAHLGADHWLTLAICNEVAFVKNRQGKSSEAAEMVNELCSATALKYGYDHPDTITTFRNKGTIMKELERYDEALAAYEQVLEAQVRKLGEENNDTMHTHCLIGDVLNKLLNHEAALEHFMTVLQKRKTLLQPTDPANLDSICETAFTLNKLERHQEALHMCQAAAVLFNSDNATVSVGVLRLQFQTAKALMGLKREKEGKKLLELAGKTRTQFLPHRKPTKELTPVTRLGIGQRKSLSTTKHMNI